MARSFRRTFSITCSQLWPGKPMFTEKDIPSQAGKVFIVTGGNAGLGFQLVKILYQKGAKVYMLSRSQSKANGAITAIKADPGVEVPGGDIRFIQLELSDLASVKAAAKEFAAQETKLNVLWNNAGIGTADPGARSKQGHELTVAVDALGPYLLTRLLLPQLQAAAKVSPPNTVRIVFSASPILETNTPPGGIIISELRNPTLDPVGNYALAKCANWFLASEFAKMVGKDGVVSIANNPGNLKTAIWDSAPWWARRVMPITTHPPIYGAYTNLWSGLSQGMTSDDGGRYVVPWGKWHPEPKEDLLLALKDESEGGTGQAGEFYKWCEEVSKDFR
jgi:NAD(P)-dependent dehydrogenase (short-subunit alcohol dehydrogenase family)